MKMRRFRALFILVAAVISFAACEDPQVEVPVIQGQIVLTSDVEQIRCDGTDAVTFTVTVTDADGKEHDVTEYSQIYETGTKWLMADGQFTTDADGEYVFYAVYGLALSNELSIKAVNDIPELPADPQEESVSFKHRMLLVQHTGAMCSNCPRMMDILKELGADEQYSQLYHHVASHSYNDGEGDEAYSEAARNLSMVCNTSGLYPMLTFNLSTEAVGTDMQQIKALIDQHKKSEADAGIAASAKFSGDDILVNIEVKAAKANDYRVAAWILEDGIQGIQAGMTESWHNMHDNALRYMAGAVSQFSFVGEKVGSLASGEKADKMFVIPAEETWVKDNCEVLVFVTAADANGNYDIVNCALCEIGGTVSYDYK